MIRTLVFSRDRAMQLHACLTSLFRHVQPSGCLDAIVIFRASSPRHRRQYDEMAGQLAGRVRIAPETAFRSQVLEVLGATAPQSGSPASVPGRDSESKGIHAVPETDAPANGLLFLVDDTIFVAPIDLESALKTLEASSDALGCSLRLGRNTTTNYVLNREQALPPFQPVGNGLLKYRWTRADGDFGYPLEISSSLYRLNMIQEIVVGLEFSDPNTLESQMSLRSRRYANRHSWMLCAERSVAFSAPINRVQDVYVNRAGEESRWSTEELAAAFDQGLAINVASLDGFVPSSCHQEVEFSLETRRTADAAS